MDTEKPKRATSDQFLVARQARRAIAEAAVRCPTWNSSLARMAAHTNRVGSKPALDFTVECAEILSGVSDARQQLLRNLINAPKAVVSNSRITDMERVLGRIEATAREIQSRARPHPRVVGF